MHDRSTILSPEARERINVEQQLAHAVIDAVLEAGLLITLYHEGAGKEGGVVRSHDAERLKRCLSWSGRDDLLIYRPYEAGIGFERIGSISLAYGSGWDVINDYTYDLTKVVPSLAHILPKIICERGLTALRTCETFTSRPTRTTSERTTQMSFKIQHRQPNGKWKDARYGQLRYATEALALEAISRLDQDGFLDLRNNRVVLA